MGNIDWISLLNAIVVLVGVPTTIKVLIDIGGKLKTLDVIEKDLSENIRPDLKDVRERFFALEGRATGYFQTASPVVLMNSGKTVLKDSGLEKYINDNVEMLLKEACKEKHLKNPYDVQKTVFNFFDDYQFSESFFDELKRYAYGKGVDINTLRRIGAIYFRDICLNHHKMTPEDIDKYDPSKIIVEDK